MPEISESFFGVYMRFAIYFLLLLTSSLWAQINPQWQFQYTASVPFSNMSLEDSVEIDEMGWVHGVQILKVIHPTWSVGLGASQGFYMTMAEDAVEFELDLYQAEALIQWTPSLTSRLFMCFQGALGYSLVKGNREEYWSMSSLMDYLPAAEINESALYGRVLLGFGAHFFQNRFGMIAAPLSLSAGTNGFQELSARAMIQWSI